MGDAPGAVSTFKLGTKTLIWNAASDEQVAWVEGLLTLPVGASTRLTDRGAGHGTFDGEVVQVGTMPVSGVRQDVAMDLMLHVVPVQADAAG